MNGVRPASILWFERLYLASLAVSIINIASQWQTVTARVSPAFVIGLQAIVFAVLLALTLWVSRKGNTIAKWAIVALLAFRLLSLAYGLRAPVVLWTAFFLPVLHAMLQTAAVALLFTPSARAWLGGKEVTEARLRSTFD